MAYDTSDELLDFRRQRLSSGQVPKLFAQAVTVQRLAPVRVRRAARRVVPRRRAAVAQSFVRLAPGPQFDQRVQPGADVERPDVGPDVPDLLLAQALDLLQVVKVLLDAEPIRRGAQDLLRRQG